MVPTLTPTLHFAVPSLTGPRTKSPTTNSLFFSKILHSQHHRKSRREGREKGVPAGQLGLAYRSDVFMRGQRLIKADRVVLLAVDVIGEVVS